MQVSGACLGCCTRWRLHDRCGRSLTFRWPHLLSSSQPSTRSGDVSGRRGEEGPGVFVYGGTRDRPSWCGTGEVPGTSNPPSSRLHHVCPTYLPVPSLPAMSSGNTPIELMPVRLHRPTQALRQSTVRLARVLHEHLTHVLGDVRADPTNPRRRPLNGRGCSRMCVRTRRVLCSSDPGGRRICQGPERTLVGYLWLSLNQQEPLRLNAWFTPYVTFVLVDDFWGWCEYFFR